MVHPFILLARAYPPACVTPGMSNQSSKVLLVSCRINLSEAEFCGVCLLSLGFLSIVFYTMVVIVEFFWANRQVVQHSANFSSYCRCVAIAVSCFALEK